MTEAKSARQEPTPSSPPGESDGFTPGRFALLLLAILIAGFPKLFAGSETFFYRDYGLFTYPVAHYFRECFWRGELPLWNPYNNCGIPLLAQWNTSLLYPPSLFYLVLPLQWSLGVFNLGHLLFAGMGMYYLARRQAGGNFAGCVAGILFAFNGLSLHMIMWISNLACYAWMPWVVLGMLKAWERGGRFIALAAIVAAFQLLGGAPELILLTWIFIGGLCVPLLITQWKSPWQLIWRTALPVALAGGLAAVQILPFLTLLKNSSRTGTLQEAAWSMPLWGWGNFLVPLLHCTPSILGVYSQDDQQWTCSYYAGAGAVLFGLLALIRKPCPKVLGLLATVLLGIVLAMGDAAGLYAWLIHWIPALGVMRYTIKFVVLSLFAFPLLAAFAFATPTNEEYRASKWDLPRLAVAGMGMGGLIYFVCVRGIANPYPGEDTVGLGASAIRTGCFLLGLFLCTLGWQQFSRPWKRHLAGMTLLLLMTLDAFTYAPHQNPTLPDIAYDDIGLRDVVSARAGVSRAQCSPQLQSFLYHGATPDSLAYYTTCRRALFLNCNLLDDIPTTSGFFSLQLNSTARLQTYLNDPAHPYPQPLADFLGVAQFSSTNTTVDWSSRNSFMPLVTIGQQPVFLEHEETLSRVVSGEFHPRDEVYLPVEAKTLLKAVANPSALVRIHRQTAHSIELETESQTEVLLVAAQAWYVSWHAYVDGTETKIWQANGGYQAIEIPKGRHEVKWVYEDLSFRHGAMVSGISLAVLLFLGMRRAKS